MFENKHIDTSIENKAKELLNSEILFAVVGDLTNEGRYGESAVFFTENKMCAYDKTFDQRWVRGNSDSFFFYSKIER